MIPQIDNSLQTTEIYKEIQIPSKTYKLNINSIDNLSNKYAYRNIISFIFEDNNLIENITYPDLEISFEIEDNNLILITDNISLSNNYTIENNYLMYIIEYYTDSINGFIDDIEAIKQSIFHILSVERYSYDIYDDNYGVELEQYIGKDFEYIKASIEDTLKEALTQDERILDVIVNNLEKIDTDVLFINFVVKTKKGDIGMEVNINV